MPPQARSAPRRRSRSRAANAPNQVAGSDSANPPQERHLRSRTNAAAQAAIPAPKDTDRARTGDFRGRDVDPNRRQEGSRSTQPKEKFRSASNGQSDYSEYEDETGDHPSSDSDYSASEDGLDNESEVDEELAISIAEILRWSPPPSPSPSSSSTSASPAEMPSASAAREFLSISTGKGFRSSLKTAYEPDPPIPPSDDLQDSISSAHAALSAKRRGGIISYSLGNVVDDGQMCRNVVTALTDMSNQLNNPDVAKIGVGNGIGNLKRITAKVLKSIATIHKCKKENPKADVDSFSFSRTTATQVERFGLDDSHAPIKKTLADVEVPLADVFFLEHIRGYWKTITRDEATGVVSMYIQDLQAIANGTEAKSRVLGNHMILNSGRCLNQMGQLGLVYLELNVATKKKPAILTWEHFVTYLTGSVDYAVVCASDLTAEVVAIMSDAKALDAFIHSKKFKRLAGNNSLGFSVFELKKQEELTKKLFEDKPGSYLASHKPQVYAETLAMMEKLEAESMPWCLTNGLDWIFGVIETIKDTDGLPIKRNSYCLETISLKPSAITDQELFKVFVTLMLWVSQPSEKILQFLKK